MGCEEGGRLDTLALQDSWQHLVVLGILWAVVERTRISDNELETIILRLSTNSMMMTRTRHFYKELENEEAA